MASLHAYGWDDTPEALAEIRRDLDHIHSTVPVSPEHHQRRQERIRILKRQQARLLGRTTESEASA